MISLLLQIVSAAGAFMILAAYFGLHTKRFTRQSFSYLLLNFIGSLMLLVVAVFMRQFGFILLEASWVIITLYGFRSSPDSP